MSVLHKMLRYLFLYNKISFSLIKMTRLRVHSQMHFYFVTLNLKYLFSHQIWSGTELQYICWLQFCGGRRNFDFHEKENKHALQFEGDLFLAQITKILKLPVIFISIHVVNTAFFSRMSKQTLDRLIDR